MMMWDPFEDMRRMQKEMDRLFGRTFGQNVLGYKGSDKQIQKYRDFRMPISDIQETESQVIATFEIPGASKENIDLNITDDALEVKAEQKAEKQTKEKGSYLYESRTHSYFRRLPLPDAVKADEAKASYADGVLRVEMPKLRIEMKSKRIEVQ